MQSGETGALVPPGDAEALADALEAVLRQPHHAQRLGHEGRRLVQEQYSFDAMIDRYLSIYRRAVHAGRGAVTG